MWRGRLPALSGARGGGPWGEDAASVARFRLESAYGADSGVDVYPFQDAQWSGQRRE